MKKIIMGVLSDRPVAYHPDIARISGGVKAGIFLSQLLYWSDKGKRTDGYIWKTQAEWEKETALTRKEQEGARKELKKRELLHEKKQGIPAKLHYKIDTDILYTRLIDYYEQTSMSQTGRLVCPKRADLYAPNGQSITESTTKNTTEITIYSEYANTGIATDDQIQPLINALKLVSRERYTNARHSKFDDIALTIHGDGATPEQIKRFGEWWEKEACWYKPPTQPALNTIADEWTNFISGKIMKNTSPDQAQKHIQGLF